MGRDDHGTPRLQKAVAFRYVQLGIGYVLEYLGGKDQVELGAGQGDGPVVIQPHVGEGVAVEICARVVNPSAKELSVRLLCTSVIEHARSCGSHRDGKIPHGFLQLSSNIAVWSGSGLRVNLRPIFVVPASFSPQGQEIVVAGRSLLNAGPIEVIIGHLSP
ncbi:MAG TPA: hypothetical protein VFZ97_17715 [Acidimicrobiales bacterium]